MSASAPDRSLLAETLNHPSDALLDALLEWKAGTPLQRALHQHGVALQTPRSRLVRRLRRHRALVATVVTAFICAIIGLGAGLAAVRAEQRKTARERDRAIDAEANDNLKQAEENLKLAKKAVNDTFDLARDHPRLQKKEMKEVKKLLLEKALPFYMNFRLQRADAGAGRADLVDQLFRIAYIMTEIGHPAAARQAYEQAKEILEMLVKDYPDVPRYRTLLAATQIILKKSPNPDEGK